MLKKAIDKINKQGILLVFPINNRPEPHSIWSEFYPRSKMKWSWDSGSDNRVSEMWQLMKTLSKCREVVYSKWYQGRATFFQEIYLPHLFDKFLYREHQNLCLNLKICLRS